MVTTEGAGLWAAILLLTVNVASCVDYDGDDFHDGNCSFRALNCAPGALCSQNVEHTRFKCDCPPGFDGDGYTQLFLPAATGCNQIGGPELCRTEADCHEHAVCEPLNELENHCVCKAGFTGTGAYDGGCIDIKECEANPCALHASCFERPGGYDCTCDGSNNYEGDGFVECYYVCYRNGDCDENAVCQSDRTCACKAGFEGDGLICSDVNECATAETLCPDKSTCNNLPGSFRCDCHNGYQVQDGVCKAYPRTCDDIFQEVGRSMESGQYTLDLDGEGDLPAVDVYCVVTGTFAITEIRPTQTFPRIMPKGGGLVDVDYPVDPRPLIEASNFCSQKVWLQCNRKFKGGVIQYADVNNVIHEGWGGDTEGECACGKFDKCQDGGACNCLAGKEGVDDGYIFNKDQLPLSKVIFPSVIGVAGSYDVGKLRCGPKSFGLPRTCHAARSGPLRVRKNKVVYIDIDEDGPHPPMLVYCNQEAYSHVGIIEIPADKLVIQSTTTAGEELNYLMPGEDMAAIISGSLFCSQRVEYRCSAKTMTESGVELSTTSGALSYLPGGNSDKPGSCGCGLTNSCNDPLVLCNCNVGGDDNMKSDLGLYIDKSDLPLVRVKSTTADNFFEIGPLQCSEHQFGIEPNCEKYRQADIAYTYTYLIDPDGPGNLPPFPVECEMKPNQGITVVHNENAEDLDLSGGQSFSINYLRTIPAQVDMLKGRSTSCVQDVTFSNCAGATVNIDTITYNGGQPLSEVLSDACPGSSCPCDTPLSVLEKENLPIVQIEGGSASVSVTLGPLKCSEIFTDCQAFAKFLSQEGVLGERKISRDTLTIDPDGGGPGAPFVTRCLFRDTIIDAPAVEGRPAMTLRATKNNPGQLCWSMNYTDQAGAVIAAGQMDALMKTAKNCAQALKLTCESAMATGMVSYKTCGGEEITKFVSADVDATCACGAAGTCDGGVNEYCNCDTSGVVKTTDYNLIISNDRLPICEVCMELHDIEAGGEGAPSRRYIRFDVSQLKCGKKQGRKGNCQSYRQEDEFDMLTDVEYTDMWFEKTGKPVVIGCRFYPDPPFGEMVIRPSSPVFVPGTDFQDGNVTIVYGGFSITALRDSIDEANYCTQEILFFCADSIPTLTGQFGIFSESSRLQASDYEMRDISGDELTALCNDERFSATCGRCPNPKRLVVTTKQLLPVTSILLPANSTATIAISDAACAYVEKDCDAIYQLDKTTTNLLNDGYYLIDPDQAGPLRPFKVICDFRENKGITQVPSDPTWSTGGVGGSGDDDGADFSFKHTYPTATPEQINSLVQNSEFCFQGVKYACTNAPLSNGGSSPNSLLVGFGGQEINSFGAADYSLFDGCACGVLGTCVSPDVTCNCDSKGSMVEQGFVTGKDVLPVVGFNAFYEDASSQGTLTVTDVRCAPAPIDVPRDCVEAATFGVRNNIDYSVDGEFLISPNDVTPFLAYCDYTTEPNNPITRVRPRPPQTDPEGDSPPGPDDRYPDDDQLKALADISIHCYQPVKVNCYAAAFVNGGVRVAGVDGVSRAFFSSGAGDSATCTCGNEGSEGMCGGDVSRQQQLDTKCNCDIGDAVARSDAAILRISASGPLKALLTNGTLTADDARLDIVVGDVFCANNPIEFNECATGFNDCAPEAECIDEAQGYRCECPAGWQGKIAVTYSNPDPPRANGRQCIDDDECSRPNVCKYNSVCANTPGSYRCDCLPGYRNVDDFTCQNIDECSEGLDNCNENARCKDTDGSYRCRCKKGFRGNGRGEDGCHPIGQCVCFGDPHCVSFDGKWNHYQGLCSYVMAENQCHGQDTDSGMPKFRVVTQNTDRGYVGQGHYAWIKEVVIEVYGQIIVIGQDRKITVNGVRKNYFKLLHPDTQRVLIKVGVTGFKVSLKTDFDLEVVADGRDEVTVKVPANLQGSMCGLCGPYNGDPQDDWTVGPRCPGLEGNVTTRESLFGNSWSIEPDSMCNVDCDPQEPPATCDVMEFQADQVCARLFAETSPFVTGGCIALMAQSDLDAFQYACKYDLCHSSEPGLRAAMCEVAEAMAAFCSDLLAEGFEWRSDDMCGEVQCQPHEEYRVCGPEIEPTCLNQNPPLDQCMESCYCQRGFMRQGDNTCVHAEDCGCTYGDTFMAIHGDRLVENCTKLVMCVDHNDTQEMANQCAAGDECGTDNDGVMACVPIPTITSTTTTLPDPCVGVDCSGELNMECVEGECVCKMGFLADCEHCKDIDECEIGENDCIHIGQHCVNTEGSYHCTCVEGFEERDGYCHDVDECDDPSTNCGPHAECVNRLGTYDCLCCMGYTKMGQLCRRDERLDAVYGAPGQECCACSGELCDNPDPVCGSDGKNYNNYAAMVVAGCRGNTTIEANYKGLCENACDMVNCDKPFQTCTENGPGGAAMCVCPRCGAGDPEVESEPVCGSNKILFPSECVFQMFACATGRSDITILDSLEPCGGGGGGDDPMGPWSPWSDCDNDCGLGKTTRTREDLGNANTDIHPLEQEAACYTTCPAGPCRPGTCSNPGQVCQESAAGEAECVCPDCQGRPDEPVCALVGNVVRTYDNECLARKTACQLTKQLVLLEQRACEDKPRDCGVVRNFAKMKDADDCVTSGDTNIGFCYGGCGDTPGECCRPDRSYAVHPKEVVTLTAQCPDNSTRTQEVEVIKSCACVVEPQH